MSSILVFIFKIFEIIIKWLFLGSHKNLRNFQDNHVLSPTQRVIALERRRQQKGYKPQWLYYRCKEEGLLKEYSSLFKNV